MILPHPESDLSLNIMVSGSEIIRILKHKNNFIFVEQLLGEFLKTNAKRTPDLFLNTLTFLYSFGLIECSGYKVKISISKK
jgi:hypothetical protein